MIPDAAVEAMARHYEERIGVKPNASWMRELLEVAAPHLLAEVWDAGFDRGFYDPLAGSSRDASESLARNPYRPTP